LFENISDLPCRAIQLHLIDIGVKNVFKHLFESAEEKAM